MFLFNDWGRYLELAGHGEPWLSSLWICVRRDARGEVWDSHLCVCVCVCRSDLFAEKMFFRMLEGVIWTTGGNLNARGEQQAVTCPLFQILHLWFSADQEFLNCGSWTTYGMGRLFWNGNARPVGLRSHLREFPDERKSHKNVFRQRPGLFKPPPRVYWFWGCASNWSQLETIFTWMMGVVKNLSSRARFLEFWSVGDFFTVRRFYWFCLFKKLIYFYFFVIFPFITFPLI